MIIEHKMRNKHQEADILSKKASLDKVIGQVMPAHNATSLDKSGLPITESGLLMDKAVKIKIVSRID